VEKYINNELKKVLHTICLEYGERLTGSVSNQKLANYTAQYFKDCGYNVEQQKFSCIDWQPGAVELSCEGHKFAAEPSYYTLGCDVEAEFIVLKTIKELEKADLKNKVAVLQNDLSSERLMPKSFSFYNPDHHKQIISLLEDKNPAAIISVVADNNFIFEDGDFDIPSVYISEAEAEDLLKCDGKVKLKIDAERRSSHGENIIARINAEKKKKVVITAHLDTKYGTPGALDNASGITVLLMLAQLIKADDLPYSLELLLLNGEDYYSLPGQMKYLEEYLNKENKIMLAINCDGVALKGSSTAVSKFELDSEADNLVNELIRKSDGFELIDPWPEGDHMLFVMNNIPAVALTSKDIFEIIDTVIHTEKDNLEMIDYHKVEEVVYFIEKLLKRLK